MEYILIVVIAIIVASALCYFFKKHLPHEEVHEFQDCEKTDMPYIKIDIQGHSFNMVADSAASVSIIQRKALEGIEYEVIPRNITLTALSNEGGIKSEVVSIPMSINGKVIKSDFVVYDNGDIGGFESKHGVEIHGLLGVEFFRKTKGKVDFKKQRVSFP